MRGARAHAANLQHEYRFNVKMACSSCSGAVERVLSRLEGVNSYEVNLEQQTAVVRGTVDYDTVLEKIKRTGKQVLSGEVVS